jgi:hypothetical protein
LIALLCVHGERERERERGRAKDGVKGGCCGVAYEEES